MLYPDQPAVPEPAKGSAHFEQKRTIRNNFFAAFSAKAGRVLGFQSEPELDYWALQETNPDVIAVCEEPGPRLEGHWRGKRSIYTFDLWIRFKDGREEYVEVKQNSALVTLDDGTLAPEKWPIVLEWAEKYKRVVRFVTDVEIYRSILRVRNARAAVALAAQAYPLRDSALPNMVTQAVSLRQPIKLSALEEILRREDPAQVRAVAAMLLNMGRLKANLSDNYLDRELVLETGDG